jgi:hypothetical protein
MPSLKSPRLATAVLVLAPLLAACGSSSTGSGDSAASPHAKGLAFAQCMRSHGVPNFPDPTAGSGGGLEIQASRRAGSGPSLKVNGVSVNAPAFQSAQQACRSLLPNGGKPPQLSATQKQAMLQFSRCMREHGVPRFPDPTFSGGRVGIQMRAGSGIDPSSPAFQAAQNQCQQYQKQAFSQVKGP